MYIINAIVVSKEDTVIASHATIGAASVDKNSMESALESLYQSYTDINPLYKIGGIKRFTKKNIINYQVYEIINPDAYIPYNKLGSILSKYGISINSYNDMKDPKLLSCFSYETRKEICNRVVSYKFYLYDQNYNLIETYLCIGSSIVVYRDDSIVSSDFVPKYKSGQHVTGAVGPGVIVNRPEDAVPYSYLLWGTEYYYRPDAYPDDSSISCIII